jgi:hypothetical protein
MTSVLQLAQIPDELAAEAAKVPGLPQRIIGFIIAEVAKHSDGKVTRSDVVERICREAEEEAEALRKSGFSPQRAREEFHELYLEIQKELESR